jgi:tol-pal system protein YbgF
LKIRNLTYLCFAALFVLTGCIATSREITELRDDISQLRIQLDGMQRNQAELSTKMDQTSKDMSALNEKLDESKSGMSVLSQRMDDIHSSLSQRMNVLSEQLSGSSMKIHPTPGEMYKIAYSDYVKGKYDIAIVGLRSYLENNPQGELAPQAQYYLADSYFNKGDFGNAAAEFDKVAENYDYSNFVVKAKYKSALCAVELKKAPDAKKILEEIIRKYPHSPEAEQSKEKLKGISFQ